MRRKHCITSVIRSKYSANVTNRHYSNKESARGMGQNITKPAQSVRNFLPRNSKFVVTKEK